MYIIHIGHLYAAEVLVEDLHARIEGRLVRVFRWVVVVLHARRLRQVVKLWLPGPLLLCGEEEVLVSLVPLDMVAGLYGVSVGGFVEYLQISRGALVAVLLLIVKVLHA